MFTQDRNLLTLEPSLFRDCSWLAQQLGRGEARLESGHAIFESGSINRDAATPGMILTVGRAPLEIVEVIDETNVIVSLLRASVDADPIPPADRPAAPAVCTTFTPQIALMHAQILAMLGLAPSGTPNTLPDQLTEDHITNPHDLALLESLGALHLIFAGLAATAGPTPSPGRRPRCTPNAPPANASAPKPNSTPTQTANPTSPAAAPSSTSYAPKRGAVVERSSVQPRSDTEARQTHSTQHTPHSTQHTAHSNNQAPRSPRL